MNIGNVTDLLGADFDAEAKDKQGAETSDQGDAKTGKDEEASQGEKKPKPWFNRDEKLMSELSRHNDWLVNTRAGLTAHRDNLERMRLKVAEQGAGEELSNELRLLNTRLRAIKLVLCTSDALEGMEDAEIARNEAAELVVPADTEVPAADPTKEGEPPVKDAEEGGGGRGSHEAVAEASATTASPEKKGKETETAKVPDPKDDVATPKAARPPGKDPGDDDIASTVKKLFPQMPVQERDTRRWVGGFLGKHMLTWKSIRLASV